MRRASSKRWAARFGAALLLSQLCGCRCAPAAAPAPELVAEPDEERAAEPPPAAPSAEDLCAEWLATHEGWCEPAGAGAWWFEREASDVSCGPGGIPSEGQRGQTRVGYSPTDGPGDKTAWEPFDDCDAMLEVTPLGHYDWDGDGHEELALRRRSSYLDGADTSVHIHRYSAARLTPFDGLPEAAGAVRAVRDVDGDGRLDLITHGPHERGPFESDCCSGVYAGGPSTLWHARPDHTLSRRDAVATEHLRSECGSIDGPLFGDRGLLEAIQRCEADADDASAEQAVTCARLGGQSAQTVASRLAAELAAQPCPSGAECCGDARGAAESLGAMARQVDAEVRFTP